MSRERRTARARALRQRNTRAGAKLWSALRGGRLDGLKFRREHPIGRYVADFACGSLRLAIEVDGGVHRLDEVATNDHFRQEDIEALGWTVLRFTNEQVLGELHLVLDAVRAHASAVRSDPHPPTDFVGGPLPLPSGEG
jgi:very-short-patch-repair endonuclease